MNAAGMVIWVLVNLTTGHTLDRYHFPTQADCLRAGQKLNQVAKPQVSYKCISFNVVDDYATPALSSPAETDIAASERARRNTDNAHKTFQELIDHPPIPVTH